LVVFKKLFHKLLRFFVGAKNFQPKPAPKFSTEKEHIPQDSIFRKFKNGFYVFFDVCACNTSTYAHMTHIFIIMAILLPCFIVLAAIYPVQVRAEIEICNTMSFNDFSTHGNPKTISVTLNIDKDLVEYFPEFITCGIEFFSPVSAYCEEMPYQKAEQQCCDRKQWIGNYFSNECYHLSDLTVFFILGYLSALVIRILWIDLFTQQLIYVIFNIQFRKITVLRIACSLL